MLCDPCTHKCRAPLSLVAAVLAAGASLLAPCRAHGNDNPVILQWFDTSWSSIEVRTPDLFMAGYGALWIPQPARASDGSVGYDVFDRFDLGSGDSPTTFGTEARFRQMIGELKAAGTAVYPDLVLNHNGARTNNAAFIAAGGWPGFYLPGTGTGAAFWGDFNDGTTQSIDPGAAGYNLWNGDLVGLIDINQASNFNFIRHPVAAHAQNIPPGTVRNRPNPANARLYPDRALTPITFTNPGRSGLSGTSNWTIYPFNRTTPMAGDPVVENATGMLMRSVQWYLDEFQVDGFRLDAAKHVQQWFWDTYFDAIMYQRRTLPSGQKATAFSFGESVAGNDFVQTYIRKDGFGNRDALDLNEAGGLRDNRNANGLGTWSNVLSRSLDNQDDGQNNGTQGVHHVYSHDNGSVGDGGSAPALPGPDKYALPQNVYVLFRSGIPLVYYNGREMHDRYQNRGFWAREGNPTALGNYDTNLSRLIRVANGYARGAFTVLNSTDTVNPSLNDVLVFQRGGAASNQASILVAVNDRYDAGTQTRNVLTNFAPGTRLYELSGAAADPVVNNQGFIQTFITVDSNRRVTIVVPNNVNSAGVTHHRGYVLYGPLAPVGTLTVSGGTGTIPADPTTVPLWRRRNTPVEIVTAPTFDLTLDTIKGDPADSAFDDFAVFRINKGWFDYNSNGVVDQQPPSAGIDAGYERFLTQNEPISSTAGNNGQGLYRQTINTDLLPEGMNYINAIAYRRRTDGGPAIYGDFRKVIYVDRQPPAVQLVSDTNVATGNFSFVVKAQNTAGVPDRTVTSVYMLPNLPVGVDPIPLLSSSNLATQFDRFEWRRNIGNLPPGVNSLTIVAFETSGRSSITRISNIVVTLGSGDVNLDGLVTIDDLYASWTLTSYLGEADMNRNAALDVSDRRILEQTNLRAAEAAGMAGPQR